MRMQESIQNLQDSANQFIKAAESVTLSRQVYKDGWNAKQIIAHIVFFHQYYASVVKAMVQKKDELPLIDEPLYKANARGLKVYSKFSREKLLHSFKHSQKIFVKNVEQLEGKEVPYKKGGRIYDASEYVDEIARHVRKHSKDLTRKPRK